MSIFFFFLCSWGSLSEARRSAFSVLRTATLRLFLLTLPIAKRYSIFRSSRRNNNSRAGPHQLLEALSGPANLLGPSFCQHLHGPRITLRHCGSSKTAKRYSPKYSCADACTPSATNKEDTGPRHIANRAATFIMLSALLMTAKNKRQ